MSAEDYSWDETYSGPDEPAPYTIMWDQGDVDAAELADVGDGGLAACSNLKRRVGFLEQMGLLTPEVDGVQLVTEAGCLAVAEAIVDRRRSVA